MQYEYQEQPQLYDNVELNSEPKVNVWKKVLHYTCEFFDRLFYFCLGIAVAVLVLVILSLASVLELSFL